MTWQHLLGGLARMGLRYLAVMAGTAVLLHALPGSPFSDLETLPASLRLSLEQKLGVDDPLPIKIGKALWASLSWDFGPSLSYPDVSCSALLLEAWPYSAAIGCWTLILAWPLSWVSACWLVSRPALRRRLQPLLGLLLSCPSFVIVGVAIWQGWATPLGPFARQLAVAVLCLAGVPFAQGTLYLIRHLEKEQQEPYLRHALMQGERPHHALLRHGLLPALAKSCGLLAPQAAALLTGSAAVERALMIPGLGSWFVESVMQRDASMILALTACYTLTLLSCSALAEWLRPRLDPRLQSLATAYTPTQSATACTPTQSGSL